MNKSHKDLRLGYTTILLSAFLFGTYGVWSRLMGDTFEPFYQAWVRSLVILLVMLPFMVMKKSFRRIERQDWLQIGLYASFFIFTQVPFYYAFNNAPIGTVQLIFYSMFVIANYIMGGVYLSERITKIKLFAIALAFLGLTIVFGVSVFAFAPLVLAALSGVAAGGEICSSKKMSGKYPPALLAFLGWACTLIVHLPLSLLLGETQHMPQFNEPWLWLMCYSVVSTAAFWLVVAGFRFVDATVGSLLGLIEVICGISFGAIIFHEAFTWSVFVGSLLIIAAMSPDLFVAFWRKKTTEPEPAYEL